MDKSKKIPLVIIVGSTTSGKSSLGVTLAHTFHGEVISADSRQVYRGLNIGTGKITKKEQRNIPHHLLDVASPKRRYSADKFRVHARKAILKIARQKKLPIIVGGTGFYIDALVYEHIPRIPPNYSLRTKLEKFSTPELFQKLLAQDPRRASDIDRHNKRRLVRALEIISATGAIVPPLQQLDSVFDILWIGKEYSKDILQKRIANRLKKRLKSGMIQEVERILTHGVSHQRLEDLGLEYRYVSRYIRGLITKDELFEQLLAEIGRYAKRQKTWFQRNKKIHWVDTVSAAKKLTRDFLKQVS